MKKMIMKRTKYLSKKLLKTMAALILGQLLFCQSLFAQLKGTHVLGDAGLQSGTQAPPSLTIAIPVYDYHTSHFVEGSGHKADVADINMFIVGVGGSLVTNAKILGGNYGASVLLAFASNKIEGNVVSSKSSLAFTDLYIQPLQLGWNTKRADFNFGYALYLPTGKYELGGDDNSGLGMFTNELSAGSTVYLDKKKEWNFSTLLSYGINSAKKNTKDDDVTVGNVLTIEGGLGKTWYNPVKGNPLPMIINAGLVYYMQFKTTDDKMTVPELGGNPIDLTNKDQIFGLGVEGNIFLPSIKSSIGLRWLTELGAKNRTQGNTFFITLAPYIKFLAPKKK